MAQQTSTPEKADNSKNSLSGGNFTPLFSAFLNFIPFLVLGVLFLVTMSDPFYGDGLIHISRQSVYLYEQGLKTIWLPSEQDTGHPTLIPVIFTACWMLFGKSLWISHLIILFFSAGILFFTRKLSGLFLAGNYRLLPPLFLCISPVFLAQSALTVLQVPLTFFFLGALYSILKERKTAFIIFAGLMFLTHLQAAFLFLTLFSIDLFLTAVKKRTPLPVWIKNRFLIYFSPVLVWAIWMTGHYLHSGWFHEPPSYSSNREFSGIGVIIYNTFISIWRILDYGWFILFLPPAIIFLKKIKETPKFRIGALGDLSIIYITHTLLFTLCMVGLFYLPPPHRYFLPSSILLMIWTVKLAAGFKPDFQKIYFSTALIVLLAGNFLYYPGKCLGDSTLHYRAWFKIEEDIKRDFPDSQFHTYAPISNPAKISYLDSTRGLSPLPLYGLDLDTIPMVIQTNLNCEFSPDQLKNLHESWHGKTYKSGIIYANVFLNPRYFPKQKGWELREPGKMELWIKALKNWLKG